MNQGRALILSPFATYPLDAGQRKRAFQSTKLLQDLGFRITFLHYAFETRWYWAHNEDDDDVLRQQWGDVINFYGHKGVGLPPQNGEIHKLDEWWDPDLGTFLNNLFRKRRFDLFVVHNIWLSKAFDHAPNTCVKALEAHDVFSARADQFRATGVEPEFFHCSGSDEVFGLNRADLVLAIKEEDAIWYRQQALREAVSVLTLPYVEPDLEAQNSKPNRHQGYLHPAKVSFGMIGSDIHFNRVAIQELLQSLDKEVKRSYAPVEVVLAGSICRSVHGHDGLLSKLGFVESLKDFYDSVDVVIVPMMHGTGVKIKSVEAIQYQKPILFTEHSAEGTYHPGAHAQNLDMFARQMVSIAQLRPELNGMVSETVSALQTAMSVLIEAKDEIRQQMARRRLSFLQISRARSNEGDSSSDPLDLLVKLSTFKQLSSWFRPLGLFTNDSTADSIPLVHGEPIRILTTQAELKERATTAGFIWIDGEEIDLADLVLRYSSQTCVILDYRMTTIPATVCAYTRYQSVERVTVAISPQQAPWIVGHIPSHRALVMPLISERVSWDPHLQWHNKAFLSANNLPSSNRTKMTLACEGRSIGVQAIDEIDQKSTLGFPFQVEAIAIIIKEAKERLAKSV